MAPEDTLLSELKSRTIVDCDTLDASVAECLGPFEDCTSNQALAWVELQLHRHKDLVKKSAVFALELSSKYLDIPLEALAVEIGMISLGLQIVPHLTGCIHIQVNPFDAWSTDRTVAGAERIISLFRRLDPEFDFSRVCIKIPSTWEGLQACRELEQRGIKTLATTLFAFEQAALAGEVGCRYIAPYVNELRVHIDTNYHDDNPNLELCVEAQVYYEKHSLPTQVLPASLTSIKECMALAGAHHITIAAPLLRQLSETEDADVARNFPSLFDQTSAAASKSAPAKLSYINDRDGFNNALCRRNHGKERLKLLQANEIFCNMQRKLEKLMIEQIARL